MRCRSSSPMAWKMPAAAALLDDPHRRLGGVLERHRQPAALRDLREVLAGQRRIELAARHRHVLRIAAAALVADDGDALGLDLRARRRILQPLQRRLAAAFLRPRRQQRRADAGGRGRVRILIDRRVDAAGARLVDHAQRLDRAAPVLLADHLVVRDLRRQAAASRRWQSSRGRFRCSPWLRRACARCRCRPSARRRVPARSTSSVGVNVPGT